MFILTHRKAWATENIPESEEAGPFLPLPPLAGAANRSTITGVGTNALRNKVSDMFGAKGMYLRCITREESKFQSEDFQS